jgi:hypothetical protein
MYPNDHLEADGYEPGGRTVKKKSRSNEASIKISRKYK